MLQIQWLFSFSEILQDADGVNAAAGHSEIAFLGGLYIFNGHKGIGIMITDDGHNLLKVLAFDDGEDHFKFPGHSFYIHQGSARKGM